MSDLIQEAQAAYANNNLEACRKLIPRLLRELNQLSLDATKNETKLRITHQYVEHLEHENAALRLELNRPREATVEVRS